MKFIIDKKQFEKILKKFTGVIDTRATMPILANVRIAADCDGVWFSATDLEVSKRVRVIKPVEERGNITVSHKALLAILKSMPDGEIELLHDFSYARQVVLRSGKITARLIALPAGEYPAIPEAINFDGEKSIDSGLLLHILDKLAFAASTDKTRYNIGGVFIGNVGNYIRVFVATDGHRLAKYSYQGDSLFKENIIVPNRGVQVLIKALKELKKTVVPVFMRYDRGTLRFDINRENIIIKTIDETFPNYNQVIPQGNDKYITVNREAMIKSVARVGGLSTEQYKGFILDVVKGVVTVKSPVNGGEYGEISEEIEAETNFPSGSMFVGLNANYVIDALKHISSDTVKFSLKDERTQVVISGDDDTYINVIMPVRL